MTPLERFGIIWGTIASIWGIVSTIAAWVFKHHVKERDEIINRPREWHLEVHVLEESREVIESIKLLNDYTYTLYEVVINKLIDDQGIQCTLEKLDDVSFLSRPRRYEFVFLKNNSENTITLQGLIPGISKDESVKIGQTICNKEAFLLAFSSIEKPRYITVNYNGTILQYDIVQDRGQIGPCKIYVNRKKQPL